MKTYSRKASKVLKNLLTSNNFSDQICRLCLNEDVETLPIFEGTHNVSIVSCPERILFCLDISVSETDGFPTNLCLICHNQLEEFYNFKKKCQLHNERLKKCLQSSQDEELRDESENDCTDRDIKYDNSISTEEHKFYNSSINQEVSIEAAQNIKKEIIESWSAEDGGCHDKLTVVQHKVEQVEEDTEVKRHKLLQKATGVELLHEGIDTCRVYHIDEQENIIVKISTKSEDNFTCSLCGVSLNNEHLLQEHIEQQECVLTTSHKHINNEIQPNKQPDVNKHSQSKIIKFKEKLPTLKKIKRKKINVLPQKRILSCIECKKVFRHDSNLSRHKAIHQGRKYFCKDESCGKVFNDGSSCKRHMIAKHLTKSK